MWKNKHVLIATLTAPVLALIAYFGIGKLIGEKPHAAEAGQSYTLVEKPKCRYASGTCGMKNGDFELVLNFDRKAGGGLLLKLSSENPLNGVLVSMAASEADAGQPDSMLPVGTDGLNWSIDITQPDPDTHRLYLVASAGGSLYYGDVSTQFTASKSD
jgi:hypothetical protein